MCRRTSLAPPLASRVPHLGIPASTRTNPAPLLSAAPSPNLDLALATRRGPTSCCRAPPRGVPPTLPAALPPLPARPPRRGLRRTRRAASLSPRPRRSVLASRGQTRGWSLASQSAALPLPPPPA